MMKFLKTAALGVAVLIGASTLGLQSAAQAMTIFANQELRSNNTSVSNDRSDLGNISDADQNNMFSLGTGTDLTGASTGGFLGVDVAPQVLLQAITFERTNGTPNVGSYPEAVDIYLGATFTGTPGDDDANAYNLDNAILFATLKNTENGGGVIYDLIDGSVTSVDSAGGKTTFTIDFSGLGTQYTTIVFVDATLREYTANYSDLSPVSDGWDISGLELVTGAATTPVPLPAGLLLLLSGLLGLGAVGRFRKKVA